MFNRVFIIAEAGSNHNGKLGKAIELVHRARESGADAIKFQDFTLDTLFSVKHYGKILDLTDAGWQTEIKRLSFKNEWHKVIHEEAKKAGIEYFATPFSTELVDILDKYVPFFKVASGDITHLALLERIASKNKGIFLSTGGSTVEEIDRAVAFIKKYNLPFICIMHCIMLYPPPPGVLNLNFIRLLIKRYGLPVGFSDHTSGTDAALLAVAMGARAIEKHFTTDRNLEGPDHKNSLDPTGFRDFVKRIRECEMMLGKTDRTISPEEEKERIYARRSIYSRKMIKKGEILTLDNLISLRPNIGIGAENIFEIAGKRAKVDIPPGIPVDYSMFE